MSEGQDNRGGSPPRPSFLRPSEQQRPQQRVKTVEEINRDLTARNFKLEEAVDSMRAALQEANESIDALMAPPHTYAVISEILPECRVKVVDGMSKYVATASKDIDLTKLTTGQYVLLNNNKVIVDIGDYCDEGNILDVEEVIDEKRVIVKQHLDDMVTATVTSRVDIGKLRPGSRVLCYGSVIVEELRGGSLQGILLEEKPDLTFADLAGVDEQIKKLTEEFDFLLSGAGVYDRYKLKFPKGKLLHGPPGNGKTSIVKGFVNYIGEKVGGHVPFYVVHVADVYRHWLGDSEAFVKNLFAEARKKAKEHPFVVILLDEPETFLKKRGTGVSTDANEGVINQFCAELDGMKSLNNVILLYGTNRLDMMDPAMLRPGRIDEKIYVPQPTKEGCLNIMLKYLTSDLPIDESELRRYKTDSPKAAFRAMAQGVIDHIFTDSKQYQCGTAYFPDGNSEPLYYRHIVNAALFPNIVEKAKKIAARRSIDTACAEDGIRTSDLMAAADACFRENAYVNTSNRDEWSRMLGREVESIRHKPPMVETASAKRKERQFL
jgi:proteasome-associated ATPase